MFFSVASPDWKPGQPMAPAGSLLFRSQAEAASFAPDAPVVAVAVRYDAASRAVRPQARGAAGGECWSARAVDNRLGGIIVFGVVPASLIRPVGGDAADRVGGPVEPAAAGFHGWDSLTMALLA